MAWLGAPGVVDRRSAQGTAPLEDETMLLAKRRVCWATLLGAAQLVFLDDAAASWADLVAAAEPEVLLLVAAAVSSPWQGPRGLSQHLLATGCRTVTAAADSLA